jgi:hypothetical protein
VLKVPEAVKASRVQGSELPSEDDPETNMRAVWMPAVDVHAGRIKATNVHEAAARGLIDATEVVIREESLSMPIRTTRAVGISMSAGMSACCSAKVLPKESFTASI